MHYLAHDEPMPDCCGGPDGCLYERAALPGEDSFFGIDRSTEPSMAGTFLNATSAPLTLEAIEEASRAILAWKPPVPCGSDEKHPHITAPVGVGKRAQCVNCGSWVVYTSKDRGVDLGGPGLFTDALFGRRDFKIDIVASEACPPDRMFLIPSSMTPAEEEEALRRIDAGENDLVVAADILAKRSLMVKL